jgi:hypothetical protein
MAGGPYFATDARRRAHYLTLSKPKICRYYLVTCAMPKPFGIERLYTQLGSCHGPAGGAPSAGVGGGGSAERIPRGTAHHLAGAAGRDRLQDTETQTSTFCEYPAGLVSTVC